MISASYRFPKDFIWGVTLNQEPFDEADLSSSDLLPLLHTMEMTRARFLLIRVPRHPLTDDDRNISEHEIESIRRLLQSLHQSSMEPVILLDEDEDKKKGRASGRKKSGHEWAEQYLEFSRYRIDAFKSYCRYWIPLIHPAGIRLSRKENVYFRIQNELYNYLHRGLENVYVGIGLRVNRQPDFTSRFRYSFLQENFPAEFIGLFANTNQSESSIHLLGSHKRPLLLLGEKDQFPSPDLLYSLWDLYRNGIPVMGYLPDKITLQENTPESRIFRETVQSNSLDISTEKKDLPEIWRLYLRD